MAIKKQPILSNAVIITVVIAIAGLTGAFWYYQKSAHAAPVQVVLTPDHPTLAASATQQFSAAAADSHGNPVASAITWSADGNAGAITAGGLFTAGRSAGDFNAAVTATVDGIAGTTAVRITPPVVADGLSLRRIC